VCDDTGIKKGAEELRCIVKGKSLDKSVHCSLENGLRRSTACAVLTVQEANVAAGEAPRLPLKEDVVP
jgi:hypothetical protein